MEYKVVKNTLNNMIENGADALDAFFTPLAVGLHYQINALGMELPVGGMTIDHSNGIISARPDDDSLVIFYAKNNKKDEWETSSEIHIYLENKSIMIDLPRFGAISSRSKITFNGSDEDIKNFNTFIELIDFQKRQEAISNSNTQIKFLDKLQFRDDLAAAVESNGNEHLRFIPQILNDAIQQSDDDLIELLIKKVKQKFDELTDSETEQHVRDLIKQDFISRRNQNNKLIILEERQQLERQKKVKKEARVNQGPLNFDVSEIFKKAKQSNEVGSDNNIQNDVQNNVLNNNAVKADVKETAVQRNILSNPTLEENNNTPNNNGRVILDNNSQYIDRSNSNLENENNEEGGTYDNFL